MIDEKSRFTVEKLRHTKDGIQYLEGKQRRAKETHVDLQTQAEQAASTVRNYVSKLWSQWL